MCIEFFNQRRHQTKSRKTQDTPVRVLNLTVKSIRGHNQYKKMMIMVSTRIGKRMKELEKEF